MKLKIIILICVINMNCGIYTTDKIYYGPGCGPSYSCPSYCKVDHKHCKNKLISDKIEQKDSTKVKEK